MFHVEFFCFCLSRKILHTVITFFCRQKQGSFFPLQEEPRNVPDFQRDYRTDPMSPTSRG
jgi:hypothetical protein